jgi:hypothetical protein
VAPPGNPPKVTVAGPPGVPATPPVPLPFTGAGKGLTELGELGGLLTLMGASVLAAERRMARLLRRRPQA